ncbi:MAG TPA: hypothetical protein VGA59_06535 [Ramlibacter sp.]|jgi:hypothetical protein
MTEFFSLFEKWVTADRAATQAEYRLSHLLDLYCEGIGPAPALAVIAEARELRAVANARLRSLWKLAHEARACVPVI